MTTRPKSNIPSFGENYLGKAANPTVEDILYYKFIFDTDSTSNSGQLTFGIDPTDPCQGNTDISKFLSDLLSRKPTPPARNLKTPSPLDFEIYKPCYVVLELDRWWNWRFIPGIAGITTKDPRQPDYVNLRHSTKSNPMGFSDCAPATEQCNIIYFCATNPKPASKNINDGSNLYVNFFQSNPDKVLSVIIDPDIKNGGPGAIGP